MTQPRSLVLALSLTLTARSRMAAVAEQLTALGAAIPLATTNLVPAALATWPIRAAPASGPTARAASWAAARPAAGRA